MGHASGDEGGEEAEELTACREGDRSNKRRARSSFTWNGLFRDKGFMPVSLFAKTLLAGDLGQSMAQAV